MSDTIAEIREFINNKDPFKMDGYHPEDFYYWACFLLNELDREQGNKSLCTCDYRDTPGRDDICPIHDQQKNKDIMVEIKRVTSSTPPRANGSLYRINAELDLRFTETGTYRLTYIKETN